MGISRALKLVRERERLGMPIGPAGAGPVIRSPFTTNQLTKIVWSDVTGETNLGPVTRAEAMRVPAVARARHIICGAGARAPLRVLEGDTPVADQPPWVSRSDDTNQLPPFHRMLWTLDDVFFTGWSLWAVARYEDDIKLRDAARVPRDWWQFDDDGRVQLLGQHTYPYDDFLLIPGPHEGILNYGDTAIRQGSRLAEAALNAAENPVPNIDLHDESEDGLTDPEIDALIARWAAARRGKNGGVAYTNRSLTARPLGQAAENLLIDGRNANAVDIARLASVPAGLLDAALPKSTLTYETNEGRNIVLVDYGLNLYWDAISARLSMDDVVTRGRRVAFDKTAIIGTTPPPTGPTQED